MVNRWIKSRLAELVYGNRISLVPKSLQAAWPQRMFLKKLLSDLDVQCVLDVGANVGQYASDLRRVGYKDLIISFEPDPAAFQILKLRSAGDPGWQVFNMALGRTAGRADFNIMTVSLFNSFCLPSIDETGRFAGANDVAQTVEVEVARLSDLLPVLRINHNFERAFLKMDTQGYDGEVFAGAQGCHSQIVGLQSEIGIKRLYKNVDHWSVQIQTYLDAGFDMVGVYAVNPGEPLVELDCYFRREVEA